VAFPITPSKRTRQPQGAAKLANTALAKSFVGLWHFASNDVYDIARSNGLYAVGAVTPRIVTNGEVGAVANAANQHWRNSAPTPDLSVSNQFSLVWRGVIYGAGTLTNNPALIGMWDNTSDASPYLCYGIHRSGLADTGLRIFLNHSGAFDNLDFGNGTITYGELITLVAIFNSGAVTLYKNGVYINSKAPVGMVPSYAATRFLAIGGGHSTVTTQNTDSATIFAGVVGKALGLSEAHELHYAPWQLFAEPQWLYTGMGSGSWTPLEVTG